MYFWLFRVFNLFQVQIRFLVALRNYGSMAGGGVGWKATFLSYQLFDGVIIRC